MDSREQRITEVLAYYIYLAEGRPEGRAAEHWLKAEQEIAAIGKTVEESSSPVRAIKPKPRILKRNKKGKKHGKDSRGRGHKHK